VALRALNDRGPRWTKPMDGRNHGRECVAQPHSKRHVECASDAPTAALGVPSDGDQQNRLMTSTAIPRDGVHLFRGMTSTSPGRAVESVERSEGPVG
jgi:hypothetical protein